MSASGISVRDEDTYLLMSNDMLVQLLNELCNSISEVNQEQRSLCIKEVTRRIRGRFRLQEYDEHNETYRTLPHEYRSRDQALFDAIGMRAEAQGFLGFYRAKFSPLYIVTPRGVRHKFLD